MLKKILLATAATVALSMPAMAADIVEVPVEVPSWTGFYVGGGIGAAWSDFDTGGKFCTDRFNDVFDDELECFKASDVDWDPEWDVDRWGFGNLFGGESDTAFRGIVQAGFDWELAPGFLIGVMGDYNFGQTTGGSAKEVNDLFNFDFEDEFERTDKFSYGIDNMFTLSGRLGFATEQALFYGLLGYSWADAESKLQIGCFEGDCLISGKNSDTVEGVTFGGGVEFKGWLWEGASTRLEYRYTDLDSSNLLLDRDVVNWAHDQFRADIDQSVQGIYLTVNWRFGGM
jgi:opacity protein-like surface antigen